MDDQLPPIINSDQSALFDGAAYAERSQHFHDRAGSVSSDTFIFVGHGCSMRVVHDVLCLQQGSLCGVKTEPVLLYRGAYTIRQIIFLSSSGFITLDALHWCSQQGISIALLDKVDGLVFSCVPELAANAGIRRLQYKALVTDAGLLIAREIARRKVEAQIAMLRKGMLPLITPIRQTVRRKIRSAGLDTPGEYGQSQTFQPVWHYLMEELAELSHLDTISAIRILETLSRFLCREKPS